jgi:hypothetical protein
MGYSVKHNQAKVRPAYAIITSSSSGSLQLPCASQDGLVWGGRNSSAAAQTAGHLGRFHRAPWRRTLGLGRLVAVGELHRWRTLLSIVLLKRNNMKAEQSKAQVSLKLNLLLPLLHMY